MHEALIPKNMVQSLPENVQEMINHRCNCVLRHHHAPGCIHTGGGGGQTDFDKSVAHLVKWEGLQSVREWLLMMTGYVREANNVLNRFDESVHRQKLDLDIS